LAEQAIPNGLAVTYYEEFISDDDVGSTGGYNFL
jgi:hypothetical protein